MSVDREIAELTDPSHHGIAWHDHEVASHRRLASFTRRSIIIDCLALLMIGMLGFFVVQLSIPSAPNNRMVEALSALPATIPNGLSTVDISPPTVNIPRVADEKISRSQRKVPTSPKSTVSSGQSKVERAINFAMGQRGKPYRFGTIGPRAFDCSGLVAAAYRQAGITLPHYTGSMLRLGSKISRGNLRRGDLIFPTSSHVGIYLGKNQMIVASSGHGKVMVQTVYSFYTARRIT